MDGVAFDLSALMGTDYQTQGSDQSQTYFLNVCGTSSTQCPDDAGDPPLTQGSAVQTIDDNGCYVLGAYEGDNCLWTSNPGGNEGIELILDNGSNNLCVDGSPRQVTIDFLCPDEGSSAPLVPDSWTAVNLPDSCEYSYTFETCAACDGGCDGIPHSSPTPGPVAPEQGCIKYPDFPPYHEGIEYLNGRLIVGSVALLKRKDDEIHVIQVANLYPTSKDVVEFKPLFPPDQTPPQMLGQLGLHVDHANDRLLATNLDAAPKASSAGVFSFDFKQRPVFYWNADDVPQLPGNFTPNDLTACGAGRQKVYVTDHVNGYIVEVESADKYRILTKVRENKYTTPETLATDAYIINGIECMGPKNSNGVLLVALMTPAGSKGKIFRVDMKTGDYTEVPLPDVHGVGMYSRLDGLYRQDPKTLWATTNTGNRRVLKIEAKDDTWNEIAAVYAREPTTCDTGDNGPTTGVFLQYETGYLDYFVTTGDTIEFFRPWSLDLVFPTPSSGGSTTPSGGGIIDNYPHGLVSTLAVFCGLFGAIVFGGAGYFLWRKRQQHNPEDSKTYVEI